MLKLCIYLAAWASSSVVLWFTAFRAQIPEWGLRRASVAVCCGIIVPFFLACYSAYDAHQSEKKSDQMQKNQDQMRKNQDQMQEKLDQVLKFVAPTVRDGVQTLERYADELKDTPNETALRGILIHYSKAKQFLERWQRDGWVGGAQEKAEFAEKMMSVITSDLIPISVRDDLPTRPLVLAVAPNRFRVMFAVPMRRVPDVTIRGIPSESTPVLSDLTKFGFTVDFGSKGSPVSQFDFTADAEL